MHFIRSIVPIALCGVLALSPASGAGLGGPFQPGQSHEGLAPEPLPAAIGESHSSQLPDGFAPTPGNGTYSSTLDIEYARVILKSLKLDMHVPDGPGPYPVIVWLHTGAWITGDKTGGPALRQAKRGYAVASVEYRLAPLYRYPAQIEDVKAAVRWLRANAARFRLDPERIGVFGSSAGGHLAALLGTTGGVAELEGLYLGNPSFSSRVKAVVDFYGPTDLNKLAEQVLPCTIIDPNSASAPPSLLIGCQISSCVEKTQKANPIRYITPDDPPFLILHGTLDCLVPWQQSQILFEALRAAGRDVQYELLVNVGHGGDEFDAAVYQQRVSDFFDEKLKGRPNKARAVRR